MYKISVKRKVLESLLLFDGSMGNGVLCNMQLIKYKRWCFCLISESRAFYECFDVVTVPELALILKYSHDPCRRFVY